MKRLSLLLVMIFILGMVANLLNAEEVTIGAGDQQARVPVDMFWKNSLYECLYFQDELGFVSGTISGVKFYNNFVTDLPNMPTKIWLGTTTQTSLVAGAWIPSTQMTSVFDGVVSYPTGANTINITFTTPFMYTGGTLVMMVNRPMDTQYYSSTDYFNCQTVGTNRALNLYSDTTAFDPAAPTGGTLSGQFPKTTFVYTGQAINSDMACLSVTGNVTPSAQSAWNYVVSVKNNGAVAQSTYTVKLKKEGNVEIGSVAGTVIQPQQTLTYTLPWTPTTVGPTYLYGEVVLTGDEIPQNNLSPQLPVVVQPAGIVAVTVGNGGSVARMPVDMYWKNSLFESVYLATELNIGGLLTGVQFYNNFVTNLPNMPTNIWVGETTMTDLAANWIPSTQLTQVFTGTVNYPSGANNINITFATPYPYGGGNLVVMVQRPMDAQYYSSSDNFVSQTIGSTRTRMLYSDSVAFDPAAPATTTPTGMFPRTTFFFITEGMGALEGTVTADGAPVAGATVSVANSTLTTTTSATGSYNFPYIAEGAHQVSATKHGYTVVTHTVNIVEDQTTTQNFAIALLPQVSVTGRVVGSDAPTVGLANATVALTGYEPYTATTNAQGIFTFPAVFSNQTYDYTVTVTGYQSASGTVVVGGTNVNMGDVIVSEIAFPPYNVVATEAVNFSNVAVTWNAPDPNAAPVENFETGDFTAFPWVMGGIAPWTIDATTAHGGTNSAKSGDIAEDQNSTIELTRNVIIAGNISFWYKVSSESGYDYLKFYIDGTLMNGPGWSGEINWTQATYPVPLGNHTFKWEYMKDFSVDAGSDCAWIDDISFPSSVPVRADGSIFGVASQNTEDNTKANHIQNSTDPDRILVGYRVWRLLAANQGNEASWTSLTPNPITAVAYTDNTWQPLPSGVYKFAVKAVYTNNVLSLAAFSNEIHKGMMGVLTGTVLEFNTNIPVAGATITAGEYSGQSNAQGVYSFSVYAGTYNVTCAKPTYQTATQNGVVIVGLQTTTVNFVMTEITLPPGNVAAVLAGNNVNVTWMEPGTGTSAWIHYDSGENDDSIGTGGVADFDVAIRFPGSALQDYVGTSLYAVKVWPAQPGTFSLRVWTGGTPTAPGTMVADQAFTPELDIYNTILLTTPVPVTGNEELWFGYRCNVTSGYPAGCDAGPADDGFGNMMYFQGAWSTLLQLAPSLNYNWNIQGYVGYGAPTNAPIITKPIAEMYSKVINPTNVEYDGDRELTGYKVWRLLQGQETNENSWTTLTPNPITAIAYQDTGWGPLPDGTYKWSVKAVYTGGALSVPAFSNAIPKITQIGTIAGIVRNMQNQAISGATVTAGAVTATTNAQGAYSMTVQSGTHSVTATHASYSPVTQTGVIVVTGQTTTVNFQLPPSENLFVDGFETYANFATTFAPWTCVDVDQSATYTMQNVTWPGSGAAMAYMVFNPTATTPPITTFTAHGGTKLAVAIASTTPPNNDWLITPQYTGVTQFKFWARSLTAQYGLERFKVGVSTTGTAPANFTIISGATHIEAPITWTEYIYDTPTYTDVPIRFGIQCLSNDAWFFMVDDVIIRGGSDNEDPIVPVYTTELKTNYPNPFNPETTIAFSLKEVSPVNIEIYNVKGQLVKSLVNETKEAGNHNITWKGTDNNGRTVASGIYYYKMNTGKYSSTKKMIMMK